MMTSSPIARSSSYSTSVPAPTPLASISSWTSSRLQGTQFHICCHCPGSSNLDLVIHKFRDCERRFHARHSLFTNIFQMPDIRIEPNMNTRYYSNRIRIRIVQKVSNPNSNRVVFDSIRVISTPSWVYTCLVSSLVVLFGQASILVFESSILFLYAERFEDGKLLLSKINAYSRGY